MKLKHQIAAACMLVSSVTATVVTEDEVLGMIIGGKKLCHMNECNFNSIAVNSR